MRRPYYFNEGGAAFGVGSQAHAAAFPEQAPPSTQPSKEYEALSSRGAQGWDQTKEDFKAIGSAALGFVPGVGEALDIANAYDSYKSGDYLGAGINAASAAVGAVPVVGDIASLGLKSAAKNLGNVFDTSRTLGKTNLAKDTLLSGATIAPGIGETPVTPEVPAPTPEVPTPTGNEGGVDTYSQFDDNSGGHIDDGGDDDYDPGGGFTGGVDWGGGRDESEDNDWDDEEGGSWQDWEPEPEPAPSSGGGDSGGGGGGK